MFASSLGDAAALVARPTTVATAASTSGRPAAPPLPAPPPRCGTAWRLRAAAVDPLELKSFSSRARRSAPADGGSGGGTAGGGGGGGGTAGRLLLTTVVSGVCLNAAGEALLTKRPVGKRFQHMWEFPGGKVNMARETPEEALARELAEEVALQVDPGALVPLAFEVERRGRHSLAMLLYLVTEWAGEPTGAEAQQWEWVPVDQLGAYPFPPLGTKLLRRFERLHAVGLVHEAMHEAATRSEEDTGAGAADDLVDDLLDSAA